jgi:hypothetical protein
VEFELTIAGGLGPVLRRALRPSRVADSHTTTTICAVSDADVVDLVAFLDAHGLRIEGVWVAPRSETSRARGHVVTREGP